MTSSHDRKPGHFQSLWLAEALRAREQSGGRLDDDAVNAQVRSQSGDSSERIMLRASMLAARERLEGAVRAWRTRAGWLLLALLLVAAAGGFAAALGVLGDGQRPVNVVWALLALLGAPTVMLLLWLLSLRMADTEGGSPLASTWLWLTARGGGRQTVHVGEGLMALLRQADLLRWGLGVVTHLAWTLFVLGAVAAMLLAFSARRYGFLWETTILPQAPFVAFVGLFGWLPAQLGLVIPDAELVRASGEAPIIDVAGRRLWSSWLIGCVLVYGLLPRIVAGLVCLVRWQRGMRALRLDLASPYYQDLAAHLSPESARLGVVSPAPSHLPRLRIASPHEVSGHQRVIVGIELRDDLPWPPAWSAAPVNAFRIDSREQRRQALAELGRIEPARLLVACDPRLSPDRGTLALIVELSGHAGRCGVWLVRSTPEDGDRLEHWRQAMDQIGLDPGDLFEEADAARRWLAQGSPP